MTSLGTPNKSAGLYRQRTLVWKKSNLTRAVDYDQSSIRCTETQGLVGPTAIHSEMKVIYPDSGMCRAECKS